MNRFEPHAHSHYSNIRLLDCISPVDKLIKQAGIYVGFILKFVCHYLEIKFKMTRTYSTIIYKII